MSATMTKNMKMIFMLVVVMFFAITQLQAQTILDQRIEWTSDEYVNLYDQSQQQVRFDIITTANTLTVKQGERSKQFAIVSITGTWNSLQTDGEITCTLDFSGSSGIARISRSQNTYAITIDFSQHEQGMKRKFLITTFSQD